MAGESSEEDPPDSRSSIKLRRNAIARLEEILDDTAKQAIIHCYETPLNGNANGPGGCGKGCGKYGGRFISAGYSPSIVKALEDNGLLYKKKTMIDGRPYRRFKGRANKFYAYLLNSGYFNGQ